MPCVRLADLPPPPPGRTGFPWTEESDPAPPLAPDGKPWPKISLVTPVRNQVRFVEETLRAIFLQGYPNLEYIVMDAVSDDGTLDVIKKYSGFIDAFESAKDRGQSHAINKGIERATGELFNWNNADDVLTPGSLVKAATAFYTEPRPSYVHSPLAFIDAESEPLQVKISHELGPNGHIDRGKAAAVLKGGYQPGALFDLALVRGLGGLDERLKYAMDCDLTVRLEALAPSKHLSSPLIRYREHEGIRSLECSPERGRERLVIFEKLYAMPGLPPEMLAAKGAAKAFAHRYAARRFAEAGCTLASVKHDLLARLAKLS